MAGINTWTFPRTIEFSVVAQYLQQIEGRRDQTLIFDLVETENMHSSFIGFLIHAKEQMEHYGGRLILKTSPSLRKTLSRMRLNDYFAPALETERTWLDTRPTIN